MFRLLGYIKYFCLLMLSLILLNSAYAQNIAINTSGATANATALLDVGTAAGGDTKGILIPRVSLSATNNNSPIGSFVNGLVVYNLASAGSWPNNVIANNFYYSDGSQWVRITGNLNGDWNLAGNSLTGGSASTPNEWIGSSNGYDWIVKTNGAERMRVFSTGDVSISTSTQLPGFLYVKNTINGASGLYGHNISTGASAFGEVAAASDIAQLTMVAFSSGYADINRRSRATLQAESSSLSMDFATLSTTANMRFFAGNTLASSNQNITAGIPTFKIEPPDATYRNGRIGLIEGGASPTKYTFFQGGNQTADVNYTLPTADGTASQVLTTSGAGVLSWSTPSSSSSGGCAGDWTLVAVGNLTVGFTGNSWSGFTMLSNKEYLVVPVGYGGQSSDQFTLTTGDAVAVFGPSVRLNNGGSPAGGNVQDQAIAFFSPICNTYSYSGFIVISGKLKNAGLSGSNVSIGGNQSALCGAVGLWIMVKGSGELGFQNGDPGADVGIYIFDR